MESLINLSKDLVDRLINGIDKKLDKEYFFMFSVSKFILLKESILKKGKDSQNITTFYFDNEKNKKYVSVILELFEHIKKNGTYKIKSDEQVMLTKTIPEQNRLTTALWVFNKLRDSIAHGKYSFDFQNESIVIDNYDVSNSFGLKCSIPLSLLNKVSFFIEEGNNVEKPKDLFVRYYKYLQQLSYKYDVNEIQLYKEYMLSLYNNNYEKYNINYNIKNIDSINYNIKNIDNYTYEYNSSIPSSYSNANRGITSEKILEAVSNMNLKELSNLVELLSNYYPKNNNERKLLYAILLEYRSILIHKRTLEKDRDKYDKKTRKLIKEIRSILGIKEENNAMDAVAALYNYMCLSFSLEPTIEYSYLSTEGLSIEFDDNYNAIIGGISKKCEEFNSALESLITQYGSHSNDHFRQCLMDHLAKFYVDIVSRFDTKNRVIITSIRNAIEHGNYSSESNGEIKLIDMPDHNDEETTKFTCSSSVASLYNLTNQVNDPMLKDNYTLNVFFRELEKIIPKELYDDIVVRLNDLSRIAFGKELDTSRIMENMYYDAIYRLISNHSMGDGEESKSL